MAEYKHRKLESYSKRDQVLVLEALHRAALDVSQDIRITYAEQAEDVLNKISEASHDGTLERMYEGWTRDPDSSQNF